MANIVTAILNTLGRVKLIPWNGKYFYTIGGSPSNFWGEQSYEQYLKDFIEVPELNAIINYKARVHSRIKYRVVSKTTGKEVTTKEGKEVSNLLKRPNWFQNKTEWLYQSQLYRDIFGNEYQYFLRPVGMPNNNKAIFVLPSQHIFIKCTDRRFFLNPEMPKDVEYFYKLPDENTKTPLELNSIIHINGNRVEHTPEKPNDLLELRKNYLYGTSKLASLTPVIKNLRQAYEGRYSLRDLPAGVLTNNAKDTAGSVPMDPKEKDTLQNEMKGKYGLSVSKNQLILTGLNLQYRDTIVQLDKLKLYEECEEDTSTICDAFGVPFELVGAKKDVTYENKKETEKQFIEDTVIPESEDRTEGLNRQFGTEQKDYEIVGSFMHLAVFQKNMKERAETLSTLVTALDKALAQKAISLDDYKKELQNMGVGQ